MTDPRFLEHDTGLGHPEQPARVTAIRDRLAASGLLDQLQLIPPRPATEADLHRAHNAEYVQFLKTAHQQRQYLGADNPLGANTEAIARLAAGGVLAAVDAVATGQLCNVYCVLRPPGHHATTDRAMGFCYYNHVAVAARYAQQQHGLRKILVVDWDVHHGNGTQDIFEADPTVFYFSVHQSPFYPGTGSADETGTGPGRGTKLNVPLPAGSGDAEFIRAFQEQLVPAADRFKPDLVLISCGLDAHQNDLLGGMEVTDPGFAKLTETVCGIAARHAQGRVVSVLEGGYNLTGIANASVAHVRALIAAGLAARK